MPYRKTLSPQDKDIFKQLSQAPPIPGIDLTYSFTEADLVQKYGSTLSLNEAVARKVFTAMRMNKFSQVKNYHLQTVFSHYRAEAGVTTPREAVVDEAVKPDASLPDWMKHMDSVASCVDPATFMQ